MMQRKAQKQDVTRPYDIQAPCETTPPPPSENYRFDQQKALFFKRWGRHSTSNRCMRPLKNIKREEFG